MSVLVFMFTCCFVFITFSSFYVVLFILFYLSDSFMSILLSWSLYDRLVCLLFFRSVIIKSAFVAACFQCCDHFLLLLSNLISP